MARVILLRHAQAETEPSGNDIRRPLSARGRQEAHDVGTWLLGMGWVPDAVVSSPATRARETARLVLDAAGSKANVVEDDRLYHGRPEDYLDAADAEVSCVLVVGHNPLIELAVRHWSGRACHMMPGSAACFEDGALVHLVAPHEIAARKSH